MDSMRNVRTDTERFTFSVEGVNYNFIVEIHQGDPNKEEPQERLRRHLAVIIRILNEERAKQKKLNGTAKDKAVSNKKI